MGLLRQIVVAALKGIFVLASVPVGIQPAFPQSPKNDPAYSPSGDAPSTTSTSGAGYLNYPLKALKQTVPALNGLQYDSNENRLPSILANVAGMIGNVVPRLPNLVSREDIFHFQGSSPGEAAGGQPWNQEFRYLVLFHHNADGTTTVEESRIDRKSHAVESPSQAATAYGLGFAYQWLLFSAANQREFRFRYLGQQHKDGRETFVVAFAQIPSKVKFPAGFPSEGKLVPFFFQGVFWVDQSTYDIVLLRTDLLAPVPSLQLRRLTTELSFHPVSVHGLDTTFWLPRSVDISTIQAASVAEEVHHYSDYHLFQSTSRIVP